MKTTVLLFVGLSAVLCCSGCKKEPSSPPASQPAKPATVKAAKVAAAATCTCGEGRKGGTVWCNSCNMGYIAGKKEMDQAKVMAAVKAMPVGTAKADHDHGAGCTCGEGKKGGTVWCSSCNMGYIAGKKEMDKAKVMAAVKAK